MRARWVQHDRSMELPQGTKSIVATWWPGIYYLVFTFGPEVAPEKRYVTKIFRCYKDGFPRSLQYRFYRSEYETVEQAKTGHATAVEKLAAGETVDQILSEHPRLTAEGIRAAIAFAAEVLRADVVYPVEKVAG